MRKERRDFVRTGLRWAAGVGLAGGSLGPAYAAGRGAAVGTDARGAELIEALGLTVLANESGYLGIVGVSALQVGIGERRLAAQSQNYYMLTRERPINFLHRLEPDDTHVLIEGGPIEYFLFHPDGRAERRVLGMDLARGERPIVAAPAGCWKALRLQAGAAYGLTANVLSPEFTPDRVRIGEGAEWVRRFAGKAPWATEAFLRELIGPNLAGGASPA